MLEAAGVIRESSLLILSGVCAQPRWLSQGSWLIGSERGTQILGQACFSLCSVLCMIGQLYFFGSQLQLVFERGDLDSHRRPNHFDTCMGGHG